MSNFDPSGMVVTYNFVIGVLLMLSSEKVASFAGHLNRGHKQQVVRITYVSSFAFGSCMAVLSATIYLAFHLFRLGV